MPRRAPAPPASARADLTVDPMTLVDPELRPALEGMLRATPGRGEPTLADLVASRSSPFYRPPVLPVLPEPPVIERRVPGRGAAPDVRVLVVNARPGERRPGVLHLHGGGYVAGTADTAVPGAQAQAQALDCAVVSVDYRLAPETRFPGALEDGYAALTWMHAHADALGVDPARIAVQGESAGGGHAAALALAARDRGEVAVAFQALAYPMLDDRTGGPGRMRQPPAHVGTFVWTRAMNRLGWAALLGGRGGGRTAPAGAVPARAADLAGLPPAWIGVGALDLFVDEDVAYAGRLRAAGVPAELYVPAGAYHAFDLLAPGASVSRQFTRARYGALARAFGRPPRGGPLDPA